MSIAREVRERRARGESLRMNSHRMNIKVGGIRSILREGILFLPRRSDPRLRPTPPLDRPDHIQTHAGLSSFVRSISPKGCGVAVTRTRVDVEARR
jgi:hypothetical protein